MGGVGGDTPALAAPFHQVHNPNATAEQSKPIATEGGSSGASGIARIVSYLQQGTPELRTLAGTVCCGFLTSSLASTGAPDLVDKVLLDFRNTRLAEHIVADGHDNIYIIYGADQLPGLLALLKANVPAWTIQSLKWMQTIKASENLDEQL